MDPTNASEAVLIENFAAAAKALHAALGTDDNSDPGYDPDTVIGGNQFLAGTQSNSSMHISNATSDPSKFTSGRIDDLIGVAYGFKTAYDAASLEWL